MVYLPWSIWVYNQAFPGLFQRAVSCAADLCTKHMMEPGREQMGNLPEPGHQFLCLSKNIYPLEDNQCQSRNLLAEISPWRPISAHLLTVRHVKHVTITSSTPTNMAVGAPRCLGRAKIHSNTPREAHLNSHVSLFGRENKNNMRLLTLTAAWISNLFARRRVHIDSCSTQIHGRRPSHHTLPAAAVPRIRFITLFCADGVIIRGGRSRWGFDLVLGLVALLNALHKWSSLYSAKLIIIQKRFCSLHDRRTGGRLFFSPLKQQVVHIDSLC